MKHSLMIMTVAILALLGGMFLQTLKPSPTPVTTVLADIHLPDTTGKIHALSRWQGKVLVINFWATWCPPCLKEIPDFIRLQAQYEHKNVQFLGIALENTVTVADYQTQVKVNYPLLIAEHSGVQLAHSWGNLLDTVPFTVLINPAGYIVHRQMGAITATQLEALIQPLVIN